MKYVPKQVVARLFGGKGQVSPRAIRKLNIAAAVVLTLQAVVVLALSTTHSVPTYISHLTGDALQTKLRGSEVTAPALHQLWQINLAYTAAAALLVTAAMYVLVATVWRAKYEAWLKKEMQPLRWAVMATAGSLLVVTLGLVAGVNELADLKSVVVFVIVASLGAAWLELNPVRRGKLDISKWVGVIIALISSLMPWLIILSTMVATNIFGSVDVPGYVWLLYATLALGWLLIVGTMHLTNLKQGRWRNYLNAEAQYTGLLLVIETIFVWELFAAVLHP
jgi:hypothetical protein